MEKEFQMIAKTFKGLENVLAEELVNLGANNVQIDRRAVSFTGDKALMYKANLWLRTASRVLKPICTFKAQTADEVYEQVKQIDWSQYLDVKKTFAIDSTVYSEEFRNSQFVKYRVKDAIADWFMEREEQRPSIRIDNPDLYINIHISHDQCTLSLDSSGESLHKRGYRDAQTEAPINEALAAGMLLMAGWNGQSNFVDPMCGSGTFLIEAALIALNIPPCIYRHSFAFEKWADFDADLFDFLYNDDSSEREFTHKIIGCDISPRALKVAEDNVKAAGLSRYITLERRNISDWETQNETCLIVTNPPYGERLVLDNLFGLYAQLGETLKHKFTGSTAWVISSSVECLQKIGLHQSERIELLNGSLDCEFRKYELFSGRRNDFVKDRKTNFKAETIEYANERTDEPKEKREFRKFGRQPRRTEGSEHRHFSDRYGKRDEGRKREFGDKKFDHRKPFREKHENDNEERRFERRKPFGERREGERKFEHRKPFGEKREERQSNFERKPRRDWDGEERKPRNNRFSRDNNDRKPRGEHRSGDFRKSGKPNFDRNDKRSFKKRDK